MTTLSESNININMNSQIENKSDNDLDNNPENNSYNESKSYQIKTNVCKRLSKELNLPEIQYDDRLKDWTPPSTHGLSNSDQIIPSYYKIYDRPDKRFNIDYLELIKDDIRNYRKLNKHQIEYIKQLSHSEKDELLEIYNECIGMFNDIING